METELQPGSSLGDYELLVRVGRGGMASVWVARERARNGGAERLVAVKAMLPELAHDSEFRAMFLEEGQIVRSIDHPNVVRVHAVSEDKGILFLAMEWVEGDSLRTVIRDAKKRRAIPIELAVRIIADAAAGLHAAHELRGWDGELRNIVHCDISPHNILVGVDGVAKLVDFGVANATVHSDFGGSEKVKGKLGYMSPEQARAEPIDRRSDVFALGIVLFELTTGQRLFQGETAAHTLQMVEAARLPDLEKVHPGYPPKLAAIVHRALQRDKQTRFQTALDLRESLERYLIEDRILVSHAGVGSLVRRVLGTRIATVRQQVTEALVAVDGRLNAGLVPQSPASTGSFSGVAAGSFSGVASKLVSEPPRLDGSGQPLSGTPRPETYDTPQPARAGILPWLSAFAGIASVAGSVLWVTRPIEFEQAAPAAAAAPMTPPAGARGEQPHDGPPTDAGEPLQGIDVGSIPLDRSPTQREARPPQASAARGPAPKPAAGGNKPPTESVVLEETPADAEVVLEESPSNADRKDTAEPEPDTQAVEPSPAPVEAVQGPFNRGVALAQLTASANRASACGSGIGPARSGRASVTFTNDGSARSVAVSPPFAGTPLGNCVASAFRSSRVPPFTGSAVTLPWSFRVSE